MANYDSANIEFLHMFGGRRLLIVVGILLYLITGALLFSFIPDTVDWLRADARKTVSASVISNKELYSGGDSATGEKEYYVTMQYEVNGMKYLYSKYYKHAQSGKQKLHVYCCADGRWEVYEHNIGGIVFFLAFAAFTAIRGTHMFLAAKHRKQTKSGESA